MNGLFRLLGGLLSLGVAGALPPASAAQAPPKKIVFLVGGPSHEYGSHEYYAGALLLARLLKENMPGVDAVVHRGWPEDASVLEGASALVIGCDGGSLIAQNLAQLGELMEKGVGLACLHYTLDVPKGKPGDAMLGWIGGYYEQHWSVNPVWEAVFQSLPEHPVTRGVKPFRIRDEWYYHMRFREGMQGATPLLTAVPPDDTRKGADGAHSGNPHVRARLGMAEHVAWAYGRPDGGRGFGFTGMHWHWNWAHDDYRKLVLNALVWIAGLEVPADGVSSNTPTLADLEENLDKPRPEDWQPDRIENMIRAFNAR
jgi:hypothetical protein